MALHGVVSAVENHLGCEQRVFRLFQCAGQEFVLIVYVAVFQEKIAGDHPRAEGVEIFDDPGEVGALQGMASVSFVELVVDGCQKDLVGGKRCQAGISIGVSQRVPKGDGLILQQGHGFVVFGRKGQ